MSKLKQSYDNFIKIDNIIFRLPQNVGDFRKSQVVAIAGFSKKIFEEYLGDINNLTFEEIQDEEIEEIPGLGLEYFFKHVKDVKKILKTNVADDYTINQLREDVHTQLFAKERGTATELMVNFFCLKNKIYAVRSDDKKEIWIYEDGIYTDNGVTYISEFCRDVLGAAYTNNLKNVVVEKIEADNYINSEAFFEFNNDLDYIPVLNGLLNLKTRKLEKFSSENIFFSKIPVVYDPSKKCLKIKNFIQDICGDLKDVETIQQFIGSCLVREQKWEKMLMCIGGGRNGKSKLAELIKTFLGSKSVTGLQPSSFEDVENFQTHMLHGKLANMYMDISKKALKNTSMLKSLSGRETITVPRKFKSALTFKNSCKFIFGANELPMSYDISDGFWGRWLLINLPYTFVYEDKLKEVSENKKHNYKIRFDDIIERITTENELSGMLNWVLDGLSKLFSQNGFDYKYTTEEVKSLWVRKSDSFMAFYMDCCTDEFESKIPKQELQKAYVSYCKEHSIKISTSKRIANAMNELGCYDGRFRDKTDDLYFWENIGFKPNYRKMVDANNFQYYKKMTKEDKLLNFVEKQKSCRIQDLKVRFGDKIVDKLMKQGKLIENKADIVRINK